MTFVRKIQKELLIIYMTDILATGQSLKLKNAQCSGEEICLHLQVEKENSMVGPLKQLILSTAPKTETRSF